MATTLDLTSQQYQWDALTWINSVRATAGTPALCLEPHLNLAARNHTTDMAVNSFLSNTGTDGASGLDRILATGYIPKYWGMNAIYGSDDVKPTDLPALFAQPTYAGNMNLIATTANFTHAGIYRGYGLCPTGNGQTCTYWTQMYAMGYAGAQCLGPATVFGASHAAPQVEAVPGIGNLPSSRVLLRRASAQGSGGGSVSESGGALSITMLLVVGVVGSVLAVTAMLVGGLRWQTSRPAASVPLAATTSASSSSVSQLRPTSAATKKRRGFMKRFMLTAAAESVGLAHAASTTTAGESAAAAKGTRAALTNDISMESIESQGNGFTVVRTVHSRGSPGVGASDPGRRNMSDDEDEDEELVEDDGDAAAVQTTRAAASVGHLADPDAE
ncbi:hypothetical protein BC828DRAFT_379075 [Blastocladiella britannica]|nr:hypothetical protein BC828DRAFT_379075 [Blastocladiella britannica]